MKTPNQQQKQQAGQGEYHLPASDRAAILARSDFFQQRREIERQRLAFSLKNGGDFGVNKSPMGC